MNIVFIMSDTFRRCNLGVYGGTAAKTPRLDALAQKSFIFDNAFLGSFPTVPNRLDIFSGRFSCLEHVWGPLPADTITLSQLLSASGVTSMAIFDNPHIMEDGNNYCRGFNGWDWIRGQESDLWHTSPKTVRLPNGDCSKNRGKKHLMANMLRNKAWWKAEEDRHTPRTIRTACNWLEENQDQDRFFLYIDLFDPHEPWDAPQKYLDLYESEYHGAEISYPYYCAWKDFYSEEEFHHIRALYHAEVSMVDHWVGVLLDKIDQLGMSEDTAVIFTSDHGFLLGEHGWIGKSRQLERDEGGDLVEAQRQFHDIRSIPLLIHLPGQSQSQRISALVQAPDLMPTILELAGVATTQSIDGEARFQALQCGMFVSDRWQFRPESLHGLSVVPLLHGKTTRLRDIAVCSNTLTQHTPYLAKSAIITEDGWCLHYSGVYDQESLGRFQKFTVAKAHESIIPTAPALYNLRDDPNEAVDVIEGNQQLAREIHQRYVHFLEKYQTPEKNLAGRRKFM